MGNKGSTQGDTDSETKKIVNVTNFNDIIQIFHFGILMP